MGIIVFYIILVPWISGFLYYFYKASQKNNYVLLAAGFVVFTLILVYGVGGLVLQFYGQKDRYALYNSYFSDWDLVFVLIYSIMASLLYYASFLLAGKGSLEKRKRIVTWNNQFLIDNRKIQRIVIILLFFDLFVRVLELNSGTYFNWLAAFSRDLPWWKTSLFQIQSSSAPLLGVFLYFYAREKKWAKGAFVLLVVLILMEGDRSNLLLFLLPVSLTYMYFNRKRISVKIIINIILFVIIFFGLIGPAIQEIRYEIRDDYKLILEQPTRLPLLMITEYIPNSLTFSKLYGYESRRAVEGALKQRFARWPAFWASINARIFDGRSFRGFDDCFRTLTLAVPSIIYFGEKPEIVSGKDNLDWYNMFVSSGDPASTVFVDAFATGGIFGLIIISITYGTISGFWVRFIIERWRSFGVMVIFGLIKVFYIASNSFGMIFVGFRDAILISIIIFLLYRIPKLKFKNIILKEKFSRHAF